MVAYLDDLLIYSNTLKEHMRHIRLVLQRLQDAGLHLKLSKCEFHVQTVSFLGYIISPKGISMDPVKIDSILSWPTPTCVLDIQTFLGFANFYRRFIRNYSRIIVPITNLLKKTVAFSWNTTANKAFKRLQKAFTTAPILRHFDPSRPAILETDASDYAEGGVVSQYDDEGILHPCVPVPFSAASLQLLNSTMKSTIKKCWPLLIALRPGVTTSKDRRISSKSIRIIRTWYGSQKLKVIIAARLAGPRNLPLSTSPLPIDQAP